MDGSPSVGYESFLNLSKYSDTFFYLYFFNITNPEEILKDPTARPALEEVGPFVYTEFQIREAVSWDNERNTITYRQHAWTEFNRQETLAATGGRYDTDEVMVTTINLVFQGLLSQVPKEYWRVIAAFVWPNDHKRLFETRTARELVFGYNVSLDVPLPVHISQLSYPGLNPNLPRATDPDQQEPSTMFTGKDDPTKAFTLVKYRNDSEVKVPCPFGQFKLPWDRCKVTFPCCGQKGLVPAWSRGRGSGNINPNGVGGSLGEQFRDGLFEDEEELDLFITLAYRVARLVTKLGEDIKCTDDEGCGRLGIPLRRFRLDQRVWANATEDPTNGPYYQWGPPGLWNLSMVFGTELFMSPAHFLGADRSLQDGVSGLSPDPGKHEFRMDIEPRLGVPVRTNSALMISARISGLPHVPGLGGPWFKALDGRNIYVPVSWFSERFRFKPGALKMLSLLLAGIAALEPIRWCGLAATCGSLACLVALGVARRCRRDCSRGPRTSLSSQSIGHVDSGREESQVL